MGTFSCFWVDGSAEPDSGWVKLSDQNQHEELAPLFNCCYVVNHCCDLLMKSDHRFCCRQSEPVHLIKKQQQSFGPDRPGLQNFLLEPRRPWRTRFDRYWAGGAALPRRPGSPWTLCFSGFVYLGRAGPGQADLLGQSLTPVPADKEPEPSSPR